MEDTQKSGTPQDQGTQPSTEVSNPIPEAKAEGDGKAPEPSKEEPKAPTPEPKGEDDPPVRKSSLDYILERKQKKLEKLKSQQISKIDEELKGLGNEEEDVSADDEKLITKVIEKKFGKHFETIEEQQIAGEVNEFLSKDPMGKYFKEFESKILQYAKHPNRANIPIKTIALEVAGDKILQIGAKMAEDARKEAEASKTGGGASRTPDPKPKFEDIKDPVEWEKFKEAVKRGEQKL